MNAWPDEDGATLVALRELDDPSPVPAMPLATVIRRGRRLQVTRTMSRVGLVAAAGLVAFLLLPGSGNGAVRLGPAQTVTSTTLEDGPGAPRLRDPCDPATMEARSRPKAVCSAASSSNP